MSHEKRPLGYNFLGKWQVVLTRKDPWDIIYMEA